jgi:hypothetical protein
VHAIPLSVSVFGCTFADLGRSHKEISGSEDPLADISESAERINRRPELGALDEKSDLHRIPEPA